MPDLDFRTVRAYEVSVGDLIAFDTLMGRLPESDQQIVARKIAHEVAEGVDARIGEVRCERCSDLENDVEEAERLRVAAESNLETTQRDANTFEKELIALEEHMQELTARHARELEEAEVRGFRRGLDEKNAA